LGESEAHIALVQLIVTYVAHRFREEGGIAVFSDLPSSTPQKHSPRIGAYIPDVFVTNVPTTWNLVGEAKTGRDLLLPHTTDQIRAFLDHLRYQSGIFVLAVPWSCEATARHIVDRVMKQDQIVDVETVILTEATKWL
jgi:hypothetical protein